MRIHTRWNVAAIFLFAALLGGCDSVDDNDQPDDARISVVLTDAPFPFDLVESAEVTITGMAIESETEGSIELTESELTINLLDLAGAVTAFVASNVSIPPGVYNRILIDISSASIELTDDRIFELDVPSGRTQVLLGDHDLEVGSFATAVLDFDVSQSFVVQGDPDTSGDIQGFLFQPVVRSLGVLNVDDAESRVEIQGVIGEVGSNFIEVGNNRFFIAQDTEIEGGFEGLAEGLVVEVEFLQRSDGILLATDIEIVSDGELDVYETAGTVDAVETSGGATFVTVGELDFRIDIGETEFDGLAGVEALVVGQTDIEVDYYVDESSGDLVAIKISLE